MSSYSNTSFATLASLVARLMICVVMLASATMSMAVARDKAIGVRQSMKLNGAQPVKPGPNARTIPFFADSFTFQGITYPYTMVGTNPRTSAVTTVIPVEIIPLRLVFEDGSVFDSTPLVGPVVRSPLFQNTAFNSGFTQFGDAFQRAQFWNATIGGGYHVLLGQPKVRSTVTISVPAGIGVTGVANGKPYGLIGAGWFGGVIQQMMASEQYDPTVLPIFFSDAVYLTYSHRAICCVVGLHGVKSVSKGPASGNGKQEINTYIWASWDYSEHFGNGNDLGGKPAGGDIDILSHEIAEWLSDPFANNTVPAWQSPLAPGYGCVDWFEVADPLIVEDFEVNGYHLQDAAFKSWFAHDVPSQAINGQYSFFGTFTTPSILCGK